MYKSMFFVPLLILIGLIFCKGEDFYLKESLSEIIFGNSQISLHFSKENGFLTSLFYEPLSLKIVGNGDRISSLDIQVDGKWLVEKEALKEALKNKSLNIEGKWKFVLDPDDKGFKEGWYRGDYDDIGWDDFPLPGIWENLGYTQVFPRSPSPSWKPYNGYAFFRRKVVIPNDWKGKDLILYIGAVDDFDWVYFNGEFIGHTGEDAENWWETPRIYKIPAEIVKAGESNTICIRVFDRGGEGGVYGPILLIKSEDWEEMKNPIKVIDYNISEKGKGKQLSIRSGVGDWIIENQYTIFPQSDVVIREGRIIYNGKETPHISQLRFNLARVLVGRKEDSWYLIPSNFPPLKYKFEQLGRTVNDDYAWSGNRCVILRNDELNLSFLTIFYSETENAGSFVREEEEGLDIVHTLYAEDILRERKELSGGSQIIRIVRGALDETLKKEQEIYDIIGLTPPEDRPEWARRAIIYSAYPGGSMDSGLQDVGGFDNFTRYLPHLAEVGFNVLWLLPVWPGLYGPIDYYKIEESLGGATSARRLINEAHKLGLKVLFDLVPHGPREESGLLETLPQAVSRDSEGRVLYWWGCLSCDYASEAWQNYMAEHASYWVKELGVDGYRVDCAGGGPANWDPEAPHRPTLSGLWGGLQVLAKARKEMRKYKSEIMLLPEATGPWFFRYSDVVYDFPFMFITQAYSQHPREEWIKWFQEWLEYEKYAYPKGATLMRFVESHDTVRFAGLNGNGSFNAFLALCALIEGAPMVYHDGDVGRGPFLKHLYRIRKNNEELSIGEAYYLTVEADKKEVFTCLRVLGDKVAIVAINMSGEEKEVEIAIPLTFLPNSRKVYLYEAFEGKRLKWEKKSGKLVTKLSIKAYYPAIVLVRGDEQKESVSGFAPPIGGKAVLPKGSPPTYKKQNGQIVVQNDIYRVCIDLQEGILKHLSLKDGDNWVDEVEWAEGRRRLGIGEKFQITKLRKTTIVERKNGELLLKFNGEGEWTDFQIQYHFDNTNRIDVKFSLWPKKNIGLIKGELWHWLKFKGVDRWLVNTFEGFLYDDFFVRHFKEAKGGRYWHIPYLYDSNRCPLNQYHPLLAVFRESEYLAILLPSFYELPENIYIRERIREEGLHLLMAIADNKQSWRIFPGEKYEMEYSILVGKKTLPLFGTSLAEKPKVICDGADYQIETTKYMTKLSRRNGQINFGGLGGSKLWKGAEIYSDKGIYGEYYDSLGNAFPLIGTSNNDPEAEIKFGREKGRLVVTTHSFLREGNSGWNNVACPLVEYNIKYEFQDETPYAKVRVMVRPFLERETTAFLAQRIDFQDVSFCIINEERISLSEKGRVWESRSAGINRVSVTLVGNNEEVRLSHIKVPEGGNFFIYNSGSGNITLFFAFMDGKTKIEPKWLEFTYELGLFKR